MLVARLGLKHERRGVELATPCGVLGGGLGECAMWRYVPCTWWWAGCRDGMGGATPRDHVGPTVIMWAPCGGWEE